MNKKYFALRLIPKRPDFSQTMTSEERAIMLQHIDYWKEKMAEGSMLIFGPVLDPKGVYGLGIVAVDNENEVQGLLDNDPASSINTYECNPMLAVVPQK